MSDYELLGSNLREVFSAVHNDRGVPPLLVANLWGERLYDASHGWGRLWKYFYMVAALLVGEAWQHKILTHALHKTRDIYAKMLPRIKAYCDKYRDYLTQRCIMGPTDNESALEPARFGITDFNDATIGFLKLVQRNDKPLLTQLFREHFHEEMQKGLVPFSTELVGVCDGYQKLIDLEGDTEGPLPLRRLTQLSWGQPLDDDRDLTAFIERVNQLVDSESATEATLNDEDEFESVVQRVHAAFKSIHKHLSGVTIPGVAPSLERMEAALSNKKCKVFTHKDLAHLHWRSKLKPGSQVSCNGKILTLGEQLGKRPVAEDNNLFFRIKSQPNCVLRISINQALLGINYANSEQLAKSLPIPVVKVHEVDTEGRCAILEELFVPATRMKWDATTVVLSDTDTAQLDQFCDLIAKCLKTYYALNTTPLHLTPEDVMLDSNGDLKFRKVTQQFMGNFNAKLDFYIKLARGNRVVFNYVMQKSGLAATPEYGFYRQLTEEAMKTNAAEMTLAEVQKVARRQQPNPITNPIVIDRALQLYTMVRDRRNKTGNVDDQLWICYQELLSSGKLYDPRTFARQNTAAKENQNN